MVKYFKLRAFLLVGLLCIIFVYILPAIQRNLMQEKFVQEESCDIETRLHYLKNHKSITIENYSDPFADFTPIGGNDWTFTSSVDCLRNASVFEKLNTERKRL